MLIQAGFKRHRDHITLMIDIIKSVKNSFLLIKGPGDEKITQELYTTIAHQQGVTEGIAFGDAEYVEWGVKFGKDARLREEVRAKLRKSRTSSPLWNGKKFTQEMEKAYQQMWEIYQQNL